jgi:hypothetical protein
MEEKERDGGCAIIADEPATDTSPVSRDIKIEQPEKEGRLETSLAGIEVENKWSDKKLLKGINEAKVYRVIRCSYS